MPSNYDSILTETIARHFAAATIDGEVVNLGGAGLHISCKVSAVREFGDTRSASLFFNVWGGALGEVPIFASMSGYGDSPEEAIVTGGCHWACVFGKAIAEALTGREPTDATRLDVIVDGRPFTVVVDALDRAMSHGGEEGADITDRSKAARDNLGGDPWLVTQVLESGTLPALPKTRASLLSVFCFESANRRVVEVKANGSDWPLSTRVFDGRPLLPGPGSALLRELAILVPKEEASMPPRELLARTLHGATLGQSARALTAWPGWKAHAGKLGEPASELEITRLEKDLGALPSDYRNFLLQVQAGGAGPGYGLIPPLGRAQARVAAGSFHWEDGEIPSTSLSGALVLAHAGCGVAWLLIVSGPHRGEVWVDSAGSDSRARRVAASFGDWYRDWLDAVVRDDREYAQWDVRCCATPSVISQMLESLEKDGFSDGAESELANQLGTGSLSLKSSGGEYFDCGDALDPCQLCSNLVAGFGMDFAVFKPGRPPKQARAEKTSLLGRLFGWGHR